MEKKAIIIGAGPAGLTAAYELLKRTDIKPIILEKSGDIGGISKTVNYKGNRIDIGGHRFFSKSDRVMNWWLNIMPIQADGQTTFNISYQNKSREIDAASIEAIDNAGKDPDKVMLVRRRLSRIYFLRKFFTYPIQLSLDTLTKLGLWTTIAIMFSYLKAQLLPRKPERNLEDFMINRFGQVLYKLFFKDYTEKVWGIPCDKISAEWGAQRIKGVSISKAIQHAIQSATKKKQKVAENDIAQKDTETSLIEQFLYPKFGPGQLWEEVARQVESMGGKILMHHDVKRIYTSDSNNQVTAVAAINNITGETSYLEGDYFFSTMPVQELIGGLDGPIPEDVKEVAAGLQYRDFITVGILLKKLSFQDKKTGEWKALDLKDTWIYIQEKDVKLGRLQLFNNWSPYMVKDPDNAWVGMEFFCNKTDDFWNRSDEYIKDLAVRELEKIGLACQANVLDATVLRMEKTYPAYFGTYERFDVVREYVDRFENLFLVGRNGMHKYNNSDHSMLTAMVAVENIIAGAVDKRNIWAVNTEQEYHEERNVIRQFNKVPKEVSILKFFGNPRIKLYRLLFFGILIVPIFPIFKFYFPFANYIPDSYSYIEAAWNNADISMWPIGYSMFLRVFSALCRSDLGLTLFQFILLQGSVIYFLYAIVDVFKPSKVAICVLVALSVFNPIYLFLSNYVTSDALFTSLSCLWFAQLIKLLKGKVESERIIWTHSIVLFLLFTIRYNALYYPVVSLGCVLLSKITIGRKVLYILIPSIFIGSFILYNTSKYQTFVGHKQFSAFAGWQLASNALYMYSAINQQERSNAPGQFKSLDIIVNQHIDSLQKLVSRPDSSLGIYYLWNDNAPLKKYMSLQWSKDEDRTPYFKKWASMSLLYKEYGEYLIKKYPIPFLRHYILPNTVNFFVPSSEFMSVYNMGEDTVKPLAKDWFAYKTNKVKGVSKEVKIFDFYPILVALINVLFICSIMAFLITQGFSLIEPVMLKCILIISLFWILTFAFSVLASPIVLRYQVFLSLVSFCSSIVIFDKVLSNYQTTKK